MHQSLEQGDYRFAPMARVTKASWQGDTPVLHSDALVLIHGINACADTAFSHREVVYPCESVSFPGQLSIFSSKKNPAEAGFFRFLRANIN